MDSAAEIARRVGAGELDPVAVIEEALERIAGRRVQRDQGRRRRACAGARAWRSSRPAGGRAAAGQGPDRRRRPADHVRLEGVRRPRRERHGAVRARARGRGRDRGGDHHLRRVRVGRRRPERALGRHRQPRPSRAHHRRLELRQRGGARGRHGRARAGHRHRRLGAPARGRLRGGRAQDAVRRDRHRRRLPARAGPRHRRADGAHGRGLRAGLVDPQRRAGAGAVAGGQADRQARAPPEPGGGGGRAARPRTDALPGEPVELPVPEADVWPVFYGGAARVAPRPVSRARGRSTGR